MGRHGRGCKQGFFRDTIVCRQECVTHRSVNVARFGALRAMWGATIGNGQGLCVQTAQTPTTARHVINRYVWIEPIRIAGLSGDVNSDGADRWYANNELQALSFRFGHHGGIDAGDERGCALFNNHDDGEHGRGPSEPPAPEQGAQVPMRVEAPCARRQGVGRGTPPSFWPATVWMRSVCHAEEPRAKRGTRGNGGNV